MATDDYLRFLASFASPTADALLQPRPARRAVHATPGGRRVAPAERPQRQLSTLRPLTRLNLSEVVGHDRQAARERVGCDQHVVRTDRLATSLELGPNAAVSGSSSEIEIKALDLLDECIDASVIRSATRTGISATSELGDDRGAEAKVVRRGALDTRDDPRVPPCRVIHAYVGVEQMAQASPELRALLDRRRLGRIGEVPR